MRYKLRAPPSRLRHKRLMIPDNEYEIDQDSSKVLNVVVKIDLSSIELKPVDLTNVWLL